MATVAVVCAGVAVLSAGMRYNIALHKKKRGEVESNVNGIKTAQQAYEAEFDRYVAAEPHPVSVDALDPEPRVWSVGSAFDTIGWAPDGKVRSTYQVEVTADGTDFRVHGWIDEDGDGVPAYYTATKSINAVRVSPNGVR
ncbi:MAG TPA: hypothetical protein DFR83_00305 [Deltaproteobacteria bacterium]|nr:hypothetical protein [Deltaproteobacteria bacterium]